MKHTLLEHTNCTKEHCPYCDGGLAYCTVCRCGEAELTTDCIGYEASDYLRNLVMQGSLDFKGELWIKKG